MKKRNREFNISILANRMLARAEKYQPLMNDEWKKDTIFKSVEQLKAERLEKDRVEKEKQLKQLKMSKMTARNNNSLKLLDQLIEKMETFLGK